MTKKRLAISASILGILIVAAVAAFIYRVATFYDTVRVVDAVSGGPVTNARVVAEYPDGKPNWAGYKTDRSGVARIPSPGGWVGPRFGIYIFAPGHETNYIGTYPYIGGTTGYNVTTLLRPVAKR
jgi:hypothetical protein